MLIRLVHADEVGETTIFADKHTSIRPALHGPIPGYEVQRGKDVIFYPASGVIEARLDGPL